MLGRTFFNMKRFWYAWIQISVPSWQQHRAVIYQLPNSLKNYPTHPFFSLRNPQRMSLNIATTLFTFTLIGQSKFALYWILRSAKCITSNKFTFPNRCGPKLLCGRTSFKKFQSSVQPSHRLSLETTWDIWECCARNVRSALPGRMGLHGLRLPTSFSDARHGELVWDWGGGLLE